VDQAFKSFSLSKFADGAAPANYVARGRNAAQTQQALIAQAIKDSDNLDASDSGLTVALPPDTLKQLLPGLNAQGGKAELADVLRLFEQRMSGTEFYANGNPTLNRLAVQSQVQQIMDSVTGGATK
jgi:hypothetical protein